MANTYLTLNQTTATDVKKFTISVWVKKSINISTGGNEQYVYSTLTDPPTNRFILSFLDGDTIRADIVVDGTSYIRRTNRVFRDVNAWYHIVFVGDSTLATADDRLKLYINGVQETSFSSSSNPPQNSKLNFVNSSATIGRYSGGSHELNGLLAHYHGCDGYAYDASAFGETDATTGIWKPKLSPSVTYGTNGFFLKFNEGAFGTDSSPNGNNFTVNGSLTPTKDTPENNFATFNPLNVPTSSVPTFSNGNNTVVTANGTSAYFGGTSSLGVSSGKSVSYTHLTLPTKRIV